MRKALDMALTVFLSCAMLIILIAAVLLAMLYPSIFFGIICAAVIIFGYWVVFDTIRKNIREKKLRTKSKKP